MKAKSRPPTILSERRDEEKMKLKKEIINLAKGAKEASGDMLGISTRMKDRILREMADALIEKKKEVLRANKKDIKYAHAIGLSGALIDRLSLDAKKIKQMADSLQEIASLADPVGEVIKAWRRPNGLWIQKVGVPIGVIA